MKNDSLIVDLIRDIYQSLPKTVARLDHEVGYDADDDEALWIWVILDASSDPEPWPFEQCRAVRQQIFQVVQDSEIPHWPHIRFRTTQEESPVSV